MHTLPSLNQRSFVFGDAVSTASISQVPIAVADYASIAAGPLLYYVYFMATREIRHLPLQTLHVLIPDLSILLFLEVHHAGG